MVQMKGCAAAPQASAAGWGGEERHLGEKSDGGTQGRASLEGGPG